MAPLALAAGVAALLAAGASADETVWSAVAFVMYGERTPLTYTYPSLTPLGAQQMFSQGQAFRARYLDNSSLPQMQAVTDHKPVQGIQPNALDNSQLDILATGSDNFTPASAMAFMQGLYPPRNQTFDDLNEAVLANHTMVDFPLDGYQYPSIQTVSLLDPTSTWIQGEVACPEYSNSALNFPNEEHSQEVYNETIDFYRELWQKGVFEGWPEEMVHYYNAYNLYDVASYAFSRNPQLANAMNQSDVDRLQRLAAAQQWDLNGNLSVSGQYTGDMIRAVAGRMLASKIVTELRASTTTGGYANKLSLLFGSFPPFIAFWALTNLATSQASGVFDGLPPPGAAMVFELFSLGGGSGNASAVYPTDSDLYVRFLYRAGTDLSEPFNEYPLFSSGSMNSGTPGRMALDDFVNGMEGIGLGSVTAWCDACSSSNLFCEGLEENQHGGSSSGGGRSGPGSLSPAVAGVVGAIVTLAVLGLAAAAAMLLGRVRFYRADKGRTGGLGGFKGAEKMASDTDLAVAKGGARHERIGSWELQGGKAPPAAGVVTEVGAQDRRPETAVQSKNLRKLDDDDIDVMGATPVSPVESI